MIKVTTASLNIIGDQVHSDNNGMRVAFKIIIGVVLFQFFFLTHSIVATVAAGRYCRPRDEGRRDGVTEIYNEKLFSNGGRNPRL